MLVPVLAGTACRKPPQSDTGQGPGAVLTDLDRAAIQKVDSTFERVANDGVLDSVTALYAEDASLLPPNEPVVTGREAIRQHWGRVMDSYSLRFDVVSDELEGRGDLAYLRGHFTLTASPKAKGAAAMSDRGKFVKVFRRHADGSWRFVIDIYNSDLPSK
jgi:uncharacterized protein (TIGR02246 family)